MDIINQTDWYKLTRMSVKDAELEINGPIGAEVWGDEVSAKQFLNDIKALGNVKNINVHINSPGGDVWHGNTIYNRLKSHAAKINVFIDGLAASAASVIAMAGDTVHMYENSILMIHDPYTYSGGTAEDMRKAAERLDKVKEGVVAVYKSKTNLPEEKIAELMAAETWMTAKEAKALGFVDTITEGEAVTMSLSGIDPKLYKNTPAYLLNKNDSEFNDILSLESCDTINTVKKDQPVKNRKVESKEVLKMNQEDLQKAITTAVMEALKPVKNQLDDLTEKVGALEEEAAPAADADKVEEATTEDTTNGAEEGQAEGEETGEAEALLSALPASVKTYMASERKKFKTELAKITKEAELAKKIAGEEKAAREMVELKKRAEEEFPHLPGTLDQKAALLKKIGDSEYENEIFKAANEALAATMEEKGHRASNEQSKSQTAQMALKQKAEALAKEAKLSYEEAYTRVLDTPEGKQLYGETLR